MWPADAETLAATQLEVAEATPTPRLAVATVVRTGACWICFPRGLTGRGAAGDRAWAAAVVLEGRKVVDRHVIEAVTGAPYVPGLLALRMGPLMEEVVGGLDVRPEVLLVDATSRDHPRRAGLALHLGAVLQLPTVGITHRPLLAEGDWPEDRRGATSPLLIDGETVACWLRTKPGVRPLVVHPGWAVDQPTAVEVVRSTTGQRRTPEPLRVARRLARRARTAAGT